MARRQPSRLSTPPVTAFAPGRVNLIGEHTDYNDGLALPFAIEQGVRVRAERSGGTGVVARAADLGVEAHFPPDGGPRHADGGWTEFVRGTLAELSAAGVAVPPTLLHISGDVPPGAGLSSSAALSVALALALSAVAGADPPARDDPVALARLCSRVENEWVGARTGLLDPLASLYGAAGHAVRIDFRTLDILPVPLSLNEWKLVSAPSGETRALAGSGYNLRRRECEQARAALGLESLRDARLEDADALPAPLDRRLRHVIEENARVDAAVAALGAGDWAEVGRLLDASHASLRDLYDASTEAVESAIARCCDAGAAGARMVGGGFGGHILALMPPGVPVPDGARAVAPTAGARLL